MSRLAKIALVVLSTLLAGGAAAEHAQVPEPASLQAHEFACC